jgi:hypothetical protein
MWEKPSTMFGNLELLKILEHTLSRDYHFNELSMISISAFSNEHSNCKT